MAALTEPMVIVGMGCRFPGGISNPSQLWDLLCSKRTGWREFTTERVNLAGYYHPNSNRPGSLDTRGANLLDEDPRLFDSKFFGLKDVEVKSMDPNQRKMLEVAYEAFESAAEPWEKFSGSNTGVFVGNFNTDYHLQQMYDVDFSHPYVATGGSTSILSNRINHVFNLRGPSMTVDTACSSSMYALHLAVMAIRNGDCKAAIVGGSNLISSPEMQLLTSSLGALSATSQCHTFDASADGYGRGEGFGALYIMSYSNAVHGKYPIRALIRGTAVNSNGRTAGISHPGIEGQEALIRHAYANSGLSPRDTGYFECHGTGTPVGDPIEVAAIGKVFAPERDTSLLIGSVKPNLGHSESASGITGVIKCVLALEHSLIPPTIGVENLNPNIDFESARVEIVTEVIPWPKQSLKRASVSSFGYGGANGHCILDHPENYAHDSSGEIDNGYHTPQLTPKSSNINLSSGIQPHNGHYAEQMNVRSLTILPFSGQHETSLRDNMIAIKSAITENTLSDIAYTLARRSKFHVKSYCIVDSRQVGESLSLNGEESHVSHNSSNPRLGFVFTGQGAQWQDMARSLFAFAAFKASIAAQDQSLKLLSFSPAWTITSILSGDSELSVQDSNISQTVCTALQIGLIDLLREWNILAHAVVGHSSGEIAAAYAAGYLSRSQAIVTAYCRGMSLARNLTEGVMMALGLSENASLELLDGRENNIKIAAINSPSSVTLSGDLIPMTQLYEQVRAQGTFARLLHTGGNAYHSHHMKEVGEFYESRLTQALEELVTSERDDEGSCDLLARRHWISTVTPWKVMENQSVTPNYWRRNLESPVQFSQAVENLMRGKDSTVDLLIEVGPHSALQGPLRQILEDFVARKDLKIPEYTPTLTRFEDGERSLLKTCGKLYCWGYPVDLITINSSERMTNGKIEYAHGSVCTNLPSYRYNYGPILCHETRIGREIRERRFLRHDLLGVVQAGGSKHRPTWRNVLRLKDIPWLNDHKLLPHAVLPGSGYVCLAIEAIKQHLYDQQIMSTTHCFRLRNVSISSAMRIPDNDSGLEIMFSIQVSSTSSKWYEFKLSSVSDDGGLWTEHASGLISMSHATASSMKWLDEDMNPRYIEVGEWYSHFTEAGLGYGPSFQGLWDLNSDPYRNIARARIGLATTDQYFTQGPESPYVIHPASLDLCHQLALIACHGGQTGRFRNAFVPVHIDEITVWPESGQHEKWGQGIATGELKGLRGAHADVQLFSQSGDPRVEITNLKCVAYHGGQQVSKPGVHEYTRLAWKPDISSLSKLQAKSLFPAVALSTSMKDTFGKLEELAICMIVELDAAYGAQAVSGLTLQRFMRWVQRSAVIDHPRAQVARSMLNTQRQNTIERICEELPEIIDVQIAKRIFDSMGDILNDTKTGVEVALQDNMLNDVYTTALGISAAYPQLENLLDLLGHRNPSLRILEVGAGTGAATAVALHILSPMGLPKRFKSYTFTDISSAFLASAQARFSQYADMEYKLLDLNRPAEHQDIMSQFDLIIASECLHAAENVLESLQMLRKLLKPEGHLIMLETTRPSLGHNLIYGTFPGWWSEDCSKDTPFLSLGDWHQALKASGFSGVDIELADYEAPFEIVSTILSTAVEDRSHSTDTEKHVHIVHSKEKKPCHEAIGLKLQDQGLIPIFHSDDGSDIPQGRRVILCEDTTSEALARATETHFNRIKRIVRNADSVLWLTVGDILRGGNAMSAVTTGLVRMLTTEMPEARHGVFHLERELDLCSDVEIISEIVRRESRIHDNDFEREFSVKDGIVHIPRLLFDEDLNKRYRDLHLYSEEPTQLRIQENGPVVADFSKPGLISSLFFRQDDTAFEEIPQDFIEVQVFSVGLNWKDLAVCTGKIDMNSFSSECSGKIIRIGSAVQNLQVGDRVYAIVWGKFGNIIRLPAKMAQRMRPNDSYEEMGGVSLVFCTAVYALNHIARLQKGESILIQGATGGVGLAALQLARRAGAQIFATAGNSVKTDFLVEECGLESSHVFSSRNERDLQRMARCNEGRGFDVILSTSTGSMMHETWRHIAPRGRFIDVGRLDVQDHATLAMEVFARNAVFASFDLSVMVRQDMSFCARLMSEVGDMMRTEHIRPISPLKCFDVADLESALLYFSQGKHIGKVVVTYTDRASLVKMIPPKPTARFDASAVYILVGGLGGFGRGILEWMVARGARNLTIWSRSGKVPSEAEALLSNLRRRNINVSIVRCDITDKSSVDSAIRSAKGQSYPIRGIIHAAVTFCDQAFEILPYKQWNLGLSAKITGTENLHHATIEHNLDLEFFVMTSSYEAVVALPTQAAYCSANAFQDAFARYRRSIGLPACAIALGLITEIGDVGQRDITRTMIDRNNLYGTGELGTLRLLEAAFMDTPDPDMAAYHWQKFDPLAEAQITTCLEPYKLAEKLKKNGSITNPPRWLSDKKFSHIVQAVHDLSSSSEEPKQTNVTAPLLARTVDAALGAEKLHDAQELVLSALKDRIAYLLRIAVESIEATKSVAHYGVDSLIAVELRSWIVATFGSAIPLLKLLDESVPLRDIVGWIVFERKGGLEKL